MQYFFAKWQKLSLKLKNHHLCIFLDYDGVLTPITNTPCQAVLSKKIKNVLKDLTNSPNLALAIISGRSFKDIKSMVKLNNIIYAGNHGLEFGNLQTALKIPVSLQHQTEFKQIKKELNNRLAKIKGILIEDKKYSLALHYRLADKKDVPIIKSTFKNVIASLKMQNKIKVFTDKKTLEITPKISWNKGKIVLLILTLLQILYKHKKILPIYLGDGLTDENAFKVLKNRGITILVGNPKKTQAKYYLQNTKEVKKLLEKLLSLGK